MQEQQLSLLIPTEEVLDDYTVFSDASREMNRHILLLHTYSAGKSSTEISEESTKQKRTARSGCPMSLKSLQMLATQRNDAGCKMICLLQILLLVALNHQFVHHDHITIGQWLRRLQT